MSKLSHIISKFTRVGEVWGALLSGHCLLLSWHRVCLHRHAGSLVTCGCRDLHLFSYNGDNKEERGIKRFASRQKRLQRQMNSVHSWFTNSKWGNLKNCDKPFQLYAQTILIKLFKVLFFNGIWNLRYWSFSLRISDTLMTLMFKAHFLRTSYFCRWQKIFWEGFLQLSWNFQDLLSGVSFVFFHPFHFVEGMHWNVWWIFHSRFNWSPFHVLLTF